MNLESATSSPPVDSTYNWMLIDMNSYFASVEQHLRPELRGRTIGVVPVESENTCVIAASYDAKRCGVKVGTRASEARRLCPGITLVRARPNVYVRVHNEILQSVDKCSPVHKVYSIDEWAIRLLGDQRRREQAVALAQRIKRQLRHDFSPQLACSIGIAPTRLLAKIASNLKKQDGLTTLDVRDLPDELKHLALDDLCGINRGMMARFHAHGVKDVRILWALSRRQAVQVWGSVSGAAWWAGFHGYDEPEQATRRRSMSHANVLEPRFRNDEGAYGIMVRLLCRLGARLRREGYYARHLRAHLRSVRGGDWCEKASLPCVQDTPTILAAFHALWLRRSPGGPPPLRVGVEVADLELAEIVPNLLFSEMEKPRRVSWTVDDINRRWGDSTIYFGTMHGFRHRMDDKIAFGRIPSELAMMPAERLNAR